MAQSVAVQAGDGVGASSVRERMLSGLAGEYPRHKTPLLYRLGLLLVAVAMVLLPLVYIGVIVLTGYGIYWYATTAIAIFSNVRGRGGLAALIVYLGPLIAGGILILFMIKPLFAGRPKQAPPRALDPDSEPLLFDFVRRLCRALGAPEPAEIRVDSEVNASASFRRGLISVFFTGDLVLTIGLPLAAGLSLRDLTGVLAHEFGHFAQRAGMRTTYVIRSVNNWFMRVVYERDAWDEQLVSWSSESDIRIGIIFYIARFFVWVTRKILWLLMVIGHAISCFMLREMEYDADRHQIWLTGSDAFAFTSRRVVELSVAHQLAQRDLGTFWSEGRLPDNLPGLIVYNTKRFEKEIGKVLKKDLEASKTGWFDTHPSSSDRIAQARATATDGLFHLEDPSDHLFSNFKGLCSAATRDHYREVLAHRYKAEAVRPLEEMIARQEKERAGIEALRRFLQLSLSPLRPLPLPDALPASVASAASATAQLKALRDRMLAGLPSYREDFKKYDDADTRVLEIHRATALLSAQFRIDAKAFHLKQPTKEAARVARGQCGAIQLEIGPRLAGFEAAAVERMCGAIGFLKDPALAGRIESVDALAREVDAMLRPARLLGSLMPLLIELRNTHIALASLLQQIEGNEESDALRSAIRIHMERSLKHLRKIREELGEEPYPFDHARGPVSIRKQFVPHLPADDDLRGIFETGGEVLDQLINLYFRCLARLAWVAEQVETAAGLDPLPDFKEDEKDAGDS